MGWLAIRHLLSRKQQSILILLGILVGTTGYVVISGMMLGFQVFITNQLVNNDAQVRISAREDEVNETTLKGVFFPQADHVFWFRRPSGRRDSQSIDHPQGWFERLERDPRVVAFAPQLTVQAIARLGKVTQTVKLVGTDSARQGQVTTLGNYVTAGKLTDVGTTGNRILVGKGLLQTLGTQVGETLLLSVAKGDPTPFKIVGVFQLGVKTIDDNVIYGAIGDIQKLNQTPSRVSDIIVKLIDVQQARAVATEWAQGSNDKVLSWDQANEGILSVFKTQDIVRNSMTVSILIVAGFGIYNILSIMVNQKRKEIAILRSVGYGSRDILMLFLYQGLILGVVGGLTGMALGYGLCHWVATIEVAPGRGLGTGSTMMMSFDPWIYVRAFALSFFASTFSSLLPARQAGRLLPIEIIRSEG